nr:DUF452 family protein [Bacteroidales bacterium]
MNKIWLNKNSKKELILFFNGWGMDMNIVNHIKPLGFNVCMLNNYNNLESLDDNFNDYDKIYIVAWSLGVWAAVQFISKSKINIEKSIAINGTSLPIDNEYGIDKEIFAATVNNWNDKNKQKFWLRMFGSKIIFNDFRKCLPKRETLEQRDEIIYLQNEILNNNSLRNYTWDTAI